MWRPPDAQKHPIPQSRWPSADEAAESLLFSPLKVGPVALRTRTWVPAMVPWRATDSGEVTEALLDWYGRFARGRPGALVVEATGIRDLPSGPLLRIGHPRFEPGLRRLVERVREESGGETALFIQLIDFLRVRRRPKPEAFLRRFLKIDEGHLEALGLTDEGAARERLVEEPALWPEVLTARELADLRLGYRERVTDVHLKHIAELPSTLPPLFAEAAARARVVGFDGVELHYAHAYTMASFLSRANDRGDGYGGGREGRLRLPLEVYAAVREAVGDDFVVGCRFLGDEVFEGGSTLDDALHYGAAFAQAGMDFLSVSKGGKFEDAKQPRIGEAVYPYTGQSGYECMPTVHSDARGPFGRNVPLAAAIRAVAAGTPVVAAGGINSFELAESILQAGHADLIASARQALADPDWFLKARLGHGEQVRACKLTNYCEALDTRHKQVTCQLWDRVQLEEPGHALSHDGRRRLTAPDWSPP